MAYKILLAERDQETLNLMETRLKARDYEVFLATHSDEALRLVQKIKFDVVLIGSSMECINGMDLSIKMKQSLLGLSMPIIFIADENGLRELILSRERGFDDFLIKPFDALSLQLRIELNLTRARERLQANPLTNLPGNVAIEENIKKRISQNEFFSVCYLDINNFKSFNDRYGFERGDRVIQHVAQLMAKCLEKTGASKNSFLGHIGGDDFIAVMDTDYEELFAQECLQEFDRIIVTHYDEADRKKRQVMVKNRNGVPCAFPLMSLCIAAITNQFRAYRNLGEIARDAAELKSYLKTQPGSHYLQDRRSKPFKSLEESIDLFSAPPEKKVVHKPLGQVLLELGLISEPELAQAVKQHIETGERLGQILIRMNAVTSAEVGRALETKLCVNYMNIQNHIFSEDLVRVLSEEFVRTQQVVPIFIDGEKLVLAMVDPVNREVIRAVEEMCGLKVIPKFILENEFEAFLERNHSKFI